MKSVLGFIGLACLATAGPMPLHAAAEVEVEVRRGQVRAIPIAVAEFSGNGPARDITQIVSANLERSGLFKPIDPAAFLERAASVDTAPRFEDWRVLNAQALVTGRVTGTGDGRLKGEYRLWDVLFRQADLGRAILHSGERVAQAGPYDRRCRL